jgi:tetratricopeptide (TPR) repeat protein
MKAQGRFHEAIGYYVEVLRARPDYAPAHNNLGTALFQIADVDQLLEHSNRANKLANDAGDNRYFLECGSL